jgi:hypothetical protein
MRSARLGCWIVVVVAACGESGGEEPSRPPPPATGWWEPQRAAITARWKQIDGVASQRWGGMAAVEPLPCVGYQPDTLGGTVAVLFNADILGTIKAFPLTSKSGTHDKETACLYLAKMISESSPILLMESEAEQRACFAWLDKVATIVVVNKLDDVTGEAVAVELAGPRVRYRAPVSTEALLAGKSVTGHGSGIDEAAAKHAAREQAERLASYARDSAFQHVALETFRCR